MALTATNAILVSAFPSIDEELFKYIGGILDDNKSDFESSDHVYDAIGDMLHEVAGHSKDEEEIKDICSQLLKVLKSDGSKASSKKEDKILSAPVCLGSLSGNFVEEAEGTSSIWLKQRASFQRKLEKAEARLKLKQEKRNNNDKPPPSIAFSSKEATAAQASSKREARMELKGSNKSMDIKIENFDIAFGDKTLLTSADLTLVYGRRYGMVGRNGIGKSTLLKMISSGQLKISSHISVLHVEQEVVGNETLALDSVLECDETRQSLIEEEKKLMHTLTNNGPSIEDSHSSSRLQEIYAELQAIEADKAPARASVILAGLGFSPEMQRMTTKEFSGGWRMRIALARALFSKPDLLLLDEPSNMLDIKAIIWLENYLQTWESTILVVSHDRRFLDTVSTDILHFHSQHIESYRGNYKTFVKTMTEKLKHQQREYEAQMQYRAHVQIFIDKYRAHSKTAPLVQSKIKMLEKLPKLKPVEKESLVVLRFPNPERLEPPVLQLDKVTFTYPNRDKPVLLNVDLSANNGSRICVVGDNGSGKTTLLKLLIGDLEPTKGLRHSHRNLVIGYFTQHHVDQLSLNVSSLEFLANRFPGKKSQEYRRQLGCFGITGDLALQSIASLSGGQKSRVAFAAMAMLNPHFLVLDEPTNHLDVQTVEALGTALRNFTGGVVLVSHDEQLIEMVCQELWVCRNGSVTSVSGGFAQYRKIVEEELAAQV